MKLNYTVDFLVNRNVFADPLSIFDDIYPQVTKFRIYV